MTWDHWIPIGVFILSLLALVANSNARFLTIREFETFKDFIKREITDLKNV